MAGLRRLQTHARPAPMVPAATIVSAGGARLLDYGGEGHPVVFVPSLINPASILDLSPDASLLRWLAGRGVRPLLVDWGQPDDLGLDLAGHVERRLLPLLEGLGAAPTLAGYCLGGTLAIAAAALRPVRALALIATPWDFAGYADGGRDSIDRLWSIGRPAAEAVGRVPMELLQAGFWQLDPAAVVAKYAWFGTAPPGPTIDRFVAVEDWANAGAPLTLPAGRDLFERLFAGNDTARGQWQVGGRPIDPAAIDVPVLNILSTADRITPAAAAAPVGRILRLDLGHVGMIVGSRARAALWEPLADWLSRPHVSD